MEFQNFEFKDHIFNRIFKLQKENFNGWYQLQVRAVSKKHNSQLENDIKSAKIKVKDLVKLVQQKNFAIQIKNLYISFPENQYVRSENIDDLRYIQKKFFENLQRVRFSPKGPVHHYFETIRIYENFEIDGIKFECKKQIYIYIKGNYNVTIKNSKFKRVKLKCDGNSDVKILNTNFFECGFRSKHSNSLYMDNIHIIHSYCGIYNCYNACIIKNIYRQIGDDGLSIYHCQNFLVSNACIKNVGRIGFDIRGSVGKIKDCSIQVYGCRNYWGIQLVQESQVHFSNLNFENMDHGRRIFVRHDSNFIHDD